MIFGGQSKDTGCSSTVYAFHLQYNQWFKLFMLEPPAPRMNFCLAELVPGQVLIMNGLSKPTGGKALTDLWCLNTSFVPQELTQQERAKKKDLTGAIWT